MKAKPTINSSGPIRFGLQRLVTSHPLFAVLIDRWRLVPDSRIPTMAVRFGHDLRVELLYNHEFTVSIRPGELRAVLQHEVHHVLFGHLAMKPADYPDHEALVVAQEVTANEFILDSLPAGCILLSMFPQLPARESTVQRYHRLARDQQGKWRRRATKAVEEHSLWHDDVVDPEVANTVLTSDLQDALAHLPEELQRRAIEDLASCTGNLAGYSPGNTLIELTGGGIPRTDWRAVLRSYIWRMSYPVPTLHRPSRRFPQLVGVIPGRTKLPGRPRAMAVIDTSGSMCTSSVLSTIRSELNALGRVADIEVVECDVAVRRVYPFNGQLGDVVGGGGTSFLEPLSREFLGTRDVDVILYFTDGYGQAPSAPPRQPLLWCLLGPWAQKPAPYGRVVRCDIPDEID